MNCLELGGIGQENRAFLKEMCALFKKEDIGD